MKAAMAVGAMMVLALPAAAASTQRSDAAAAELRVTRAEGVAGLEPPFALTDAREAMKRAQAAPASRRRLDAATADLALTRLELHLGDPLGESDPSLWW